MSHKNKNQSKQIIEITSTMLNVDYVPVTDIKEIKAMERGENDWREATLASRGLVHCVAPIKGTVYKIRQSDSPLGEHLPKALLIHTLGHKKGRIFYGKDGVLRVVFDLPREELECLLKRITWEAYKLAGFTS
jgi:hypothetical protein